MQWMPSIRKHRGPGRPWYAAARIFRERHRSWSLLLPAVVWLSLCAVSFSQEDAVDVEEFRWATHRTSPADLLIDEANVFSDSKADLDSEQQRAWRALTDEVVRRRLAVREEFPDDFTSRWEAAFYRYAEVRRAAWDSGSLTVREKAKANPFRGADETSQPTTDAVGEYSLLADILDHPQDFVGRPVVFRGILKRPVAVELGRLENSFPAESMQLTIGDLLPLDGGTSPFAVVHTTSVERTSGDNAGIGPWPRNAAALPVLVKGWVVKLWGDQRPLIYCESVRELSLNPPETLIRQFAVSRQPIMTEEAWLYYETLANLDAIESLRWNNPQVWRALFPDVATEGAADSPQRAAARFLRSRLDDLLLEIAEKVQTEQAQLEKQRDTKEITSQQFDRELKRLAYLANERRERFKRARTDPRTFDTYVDVFMNPDVWQGRLVTLSGHVRHVVSYPAGHPEFAGRKLHELWLYTDDSQNNPAVIVTPGLPAEFPVNASLIDQVTVTGCVFKQYVYRSQESRRIAPLILAGSVQWAPTDAHLLALQEEGHLEQGSVLSQRAGAVRADRPGGMALLLVGFLATLSVMVLWGRAQRDRRDHRSLMNRIAEKPEFESSLDGEYSPRLSEYTSGYDL